MIIPQVTDGKTEASTELSLAQSDMKSKQGLGLIYSELPEAIPIHIPKLPGQREAPLAPLSPAGTGPTPMPLPSVLPPPSSHQGH